jgi:hypothetical protein
MNAVNRILGEVIRPPTNAEKTEAFPAYWYAKDVLKGRFPEGEKAIATDPVVSYAYARDVLKARFQEGEVAIVAHPSCVTNYLRLFPEAKLDWAMNGLIDWTEL